VDIAHARDYRVHQTATRTAEDAEHLNKREANFLHSAAVHAGWHVKIHQCSEENDAGEDNSNERYHAEHRERRPPARDAALAAAHRVDGAIARATERTVVALGVVALDAATRVVQETAFIVEALVNLGILVDPRRRARRVPRLFSKREPPILARCSCLRALRALRFARGFSKRAVRADVAVVGAYVRGETTDWARFERHVATIALVTLRALRALRFARGISKRAVWAYIAVVGAYVRRETTDWARFDRRVAACALVTLRALRCPRRVDAIKSRHNGETHCAAVTAGVLVGGTWYFRFPITTRVAMRTQHTRHIGSVCAV